jgi:hypothetical protein
MMIRMFLLAWCLQAWGWGQDVVAPVMIRAAYHNPVKPVAEFFIADQAGAIVPLNLNSEGLSYAQMTVPVNGSLVIYKNKMVDPKNPQASVAASTKIPTDWKRLIVLIFPGTAQADQPDYRLLLINDAPTAFKKGESRVINLTQAETALQAGEHKLSLPSGKVTEVPAVKKVNDFNMAQTNFYYKEGAEWVAFTERQLQFMDTTKRIFLVYLTPGSTQPFVTTLVDNTPETPAAPPP